MNLIYWLFAIIKDFVPFEHKDDRANLKAEMSVEFEKLKHRGGFASKIHSILSIVWVRFALVLAYLPVSKWVESYFFPGRKFNHDFEDFDDEDDFDEDDFEDDLDDEEDY